MPRSRHAGDSLDVAVAIDQVCDEFEKALRAGGQSRIDDYLGRVAESRRSELLEELIGIELEVRQRQGEACDADEFASRYPQFSDAIRAVFNRPGTLRTVSFADSPDSTHGQGRTLTVRCPRCRKTFQAGESRGLDELTCPACQGSFRLLDSAADEGEETVKRLGRFELLEQLGAGAFGAVWKARDTQLDRIVAVKIPRRSQLDLVDVEQFLREARAAAQLKHPNIVGVHELGQEGERVYIVSDFIEGQSLDEWIADGRLLPKKAASLCAQIALALHHAHEAGVVHRDLKPGNIMIDSAGEPHVMDFGLAKRESAEITMTAQGQILGTPAYMSPEQASGEGHSADRRSDVYSLGVILYELLTGERPFAGSVRGILKQVVEDPPPAPRKLDRRMPRDIETICLKCLEKSPSWRYDRALDLAGDLERFVCDEPILARRVGRLERSLRWCRRKPATAALGVAAMLLLVAGFITATLVRQANDARALATVTQEFEDVLSSATLSTDFLPSADAFADAVSRLAPERAEETRRRVTARYASLLEQKLRRPRLEVTDAESIREALALLRERDESAAEPLDELLAARLGSWQLVAETAAPFKNLSELFDAQQVRVDGRGLMLAADVDERVSTRMQPTAAIRIEAIFEPTWSRGSLIEVRFDEAGRYYALALRAIRPSSVDEEPESAKPLSFAHADGRSQRAVIEIKKEGATLRRLTVELKELLGQPLTVRAERNENRLEMQLNEDPPLIFSDIFPIQMSDQAVVELKWPTETGLTSLRAWNKRQPAMTSPLQKADQLYLSGYFAKALPEYKSQATALAGTTFGDEAAYKLAACLVALDRASEARHEFEQLFARAGGRWSALAGCHLWEMCLHEGNWDGAEAVYENLAAHHRFEDLVAAVPDGLRQTILSHYKATWTLERVFARRTDIVRDMERAVAVSRLFSESGTPDVTWQLDLVRAYRFTQNYRAAAELARQVLLEHEDPRAAYHLARIYRRMGKPREALRCVEQWAPLMRTHHAVARLHALLAAGNWAKAESEAERLVASTDPQPGQVRSYAWLIRGFLHWRNGQKEAAEEEWAAGYEEMRRLVGRTTLGDTTQLLIVMLGALSDTLTDEDAGRMVALVSSAGHRSALIKAAGSLLPRHSLERVLKDMWRSPRGRDFAQRYAFDQVPARDLAALPMMLVGYEYLRQHAFAHPPVGRQDDLLWEVCEELFGATVERGEISSPQIVQLGLTWKGTTSFLGWGSVGQQLRPRHRSLLAYVFAHRFLRLEKVDEARNFLKIAIKDAEPNSSLRKLAEEDQRLLEAGLGSLRLSCSDELLTVGVWQAERFAREVKVAAASPADLELPAGRYVLKFRHPDTEKSVQESFTLSPADRLEISVAAQNTAAR